MVNKEWIYFIESTCKNCNNKFIKVGYTEQDVEQRLKELSYSTPTELEILDFFPGDKELEAKIKENFKDLSIHNHSEEWFKADKKIYDYIREKCFTKENKETKHFFNVFKRIKAKFKKRKEQGKRIKDEKQVREELIERYLRKLRVEKKLEEYQREDFIKFAHEIPLKDLRDFLKAFKRTEVGQDFLGYSFSDFSFLDKQELYQIFWNIRKRCDKKIRGRLPFINI
jgi:hypothetical protein